MTDYFELYVQLLRKYHTLIALNLTPHDDFINEMRVARQHLTKKQLDMIEDLRLGGIPVV